MTKRLLTILLSTSLLISCSDKREEPKVQNEGKEIAAACIKRMIGTGDTAKMVFKILPPGFPPGLSEEDMEEIKKRQDSTKKRMLSIDPYIVVIDPVSFSKRNIKDEDYDLPDNMVNKMKREGYEELEYAGSFTAADTGYLSQQLGLKVTNKEPWKKGEELHFHDERFIAVFDFASIKYSSEAGKATVKGSTWCGGTCGYGYYMLLQKKGMDWEVVYFTKTNES